MSISIKKFCGYVWASPLTFFGLIYALLFQFLGLYEWNSSRGDGLIWTVSPSSPIWFRNVWSRWFGHTLGNVVVLNFEPQKESRMLEYELCHVRHSMRLGIFYPILYVFSSLIVYLGCEASNAFWSNTFEIDSRRFAGQPIDLEGAVKKLRAR